MMAKYGKQAGRHNGTSTTSLNFGKMWDYERRQERCSKGYSGAGGLLPRREVGGGRELRINNQIRKGDKVKKGEI